MMFSVLSAGGSCSHAITVSTDVLLGVSIPVREKLARNEWVAALDYSIVPSHLRLALSDNARRMSNYCYSVWT